MGIVFLAIAPALAFLYFTKLPWTGFVIGLLALAAAWFGGERFVLRHVHRLAEAVRRLGSGDLSARTGMTGAPGEIGVLARSFDDMADNLERRVKEHEQAEQRSLNRALQQTSVAALGQFALTSTDCSALLNQAVLLISQTLEVDLCRILELSPEGKSLWMRAGVGWKQETAGMAAMDADKASPTGYTLVSGEPVIIKDLRAETRFQSEPLLVEHSVVSGVSVAIGSREKTYGVLGVYSTRPREFNGDDVQFLLAVANALAGAVERDRAEAEMQKLAQFARLNPNPVMELAADGTVTYFNQAAFKLAAAVKRGHPRDFLPPECPSIVRSCLTTGESKWRLESRIEGRVLSWSLHPIAASQVVHAYVTDITERLSLEEHLRHAQKMESVGQLAAGVAHDFNNMLTVIQGHAGILMARSEFPPGLKDSAQAIFFAAERAASLTRQLLMFSRRTVIQPKPTDLREIVGNISKMLKRLLGESITLEFSRPPDLPLIRGDAGMIEQVILNLTVNARDAMASGGTLIITLQSVTVDAAYVELHPEARTGPFVVLRVTDTGCGMDAATQRRIFEPFFTTKEPGKGTGLGLATVYGTVKLHEGWIEVTSGVGKGTSFGICFPAMPEMAKAVRPTDSLFPSIRGGNETILLVEDEASVLNMGKIILQDYGYRVLEAGSGMEALDVWRRHQGPIELLLTDIVMPEGLSGLDLAQKLLADKPGLKVIYTSGYNTNYLNTEFFRKGAAVFVQKPYTRSSLAKAVRECLDEPRASQ